MALATAGLQQKDNSSSYQNNLAKMKQLSSKPTGYSKIFGSCRNMLKRKQRKKCNKNRFKIETKRIGKQLKKKEESKRICQKLLKRRKINNRVKEYLNKVKI